MSVETIRCARCGREAEPLGQGPRNNWLVPDGWEGSVSEPICPGCQYAEWHPRCTALRVESGYGARVDMVALERGKQITVEIDGAPVLIRSLAELKTLPEGELGWCDYKDLSVSWIYDDEQPVDWSCPSCGGTSFEGVHRDYPASTSRAHRSPRISS